MTTTLTGVKTSLGFHWIITDEGDTISTKQPCPYVISGQEFIAFYEALIAELSQQPSRVKFKRFQEMFEQDRDGIAVVPPTVEEFLANPEYADFFPEVVQWAFERMDFSPYCVVDTVRPKKMD